MAKQKKQSQLEKTKNKLRLESEKQKKAREEALGFGKNPDGISKKNGALKSLVLAKLILLGLFPLVFFLYSPLLLPLCAAYACTYFVSLRLEKKANKGYRKNLWISIPRWDGIIALTLIGIVLFGTILTISTTNTEPSVFEGKTQEQIERTLRNDYNLSASNAKKAAEILEQNGMGLSREKKWTLQAFTMYTGHREFFIPKNNSVFGYGKRVENSGGSGGGSGNGGTMVIKGKDDEEPIRIEGISGGTVGLSDIPFMNVFTQIMLVLNIGLVLAVAASGAYVVWSLYGLGKELGGKSFLSVKKKENPADGGTPQKDSGKKPENS